MQPESENVSVPWTGFDVFWFLVFGLTTFSIANSAAYVACHSQLEERIIDVSQESEKKLHPIAQMIQDGKNEPMILLVAFLAAVVAAPLFEEFFFRLLFQGWLESKLSYYRSSYTSGIAIVIVSLCFAVIHVENQNNMVVPRELFYKMTASVAAHLLVFTIGIFYLIRIRNVNLTDVLVGTKQCHRLPLEMFVIICLITVLLIFGLTAFLRMSFPDVFIDPVPIFFFSLVLGFLYSRTRNLLYCVLLHACLNAMSLVIVLLLG